MPPPFLAALFRAPSFTIFFFIFMPAIIFSCLFFLPPGPLIAAFPATVMEGSSSACLSTPRLLLLLLSVFIIRGQADIWFSHEVPDAATSSSACQLTDNYHARPCLSHSSLPLENEGCPTGPRDRHLTDREPKSLAYHASLWDIVHTSDSEWVRLHRSELASHDGHTHGHHTPSSVMLRSGHATWSCPCTSQHKEELFLRRPHEVNGLESMNTWGRSSAWHKQMLSLITACPLPVGECSPLHSPRPSLVCLPSSPAFQPSFYIQPVVMPPPSQLPPPPPSQPGLSPRPSGSAACLPLPPATTTTTTRLGSCPAFKKEGGG